LRIHCRDARISAVDARDFAAVAAEALTGGTLHHNWKAPDQFQTFAQDYAPYFLHRG
jgi:uncharacterized protein YbjT (DUF2867 family)